MKNKIILFLKWSEKYTKTDMVYLASSGFWINASTIFISAFSFILSIAFANLLSKESFGIYQFVISTGTILSAFTLTGMNTVITKLTAQGKESVLLSSIKQQLSFNRIAGSIGIGISFYYLLKGNLPYSLMFLIVACAIPLINTYNSYTAYLNGKRDFKNLSIFNIGLALFYSIGMIVTILLKGSPLALVGVYFFTNTVGTILIFLSVKNKYLLTKKEKIDLSFAKKLSFSNIPSALLLSIDNILIYHLLGPTILAVYAIATQLPERALSLLRSITTAAIPKFSTYSPSEIRSIIVTKTLKMFAITIFGAGIYIILAKTILTYLFPAYISVLSTTYLGAVASACAITTSFVLSAFISSHENKKVFMVNILYPILSIGFIGMGAYSAGMNGAIIGKIAGSISASILTLLAIYSSPKKTPQEAD